MAVIRDSRFRVYLYDMGASRGPGTLQAIIDDAKTIGVSAYANDVGEAFFTLPQTHKALAAIAPLERHYKIVRSDGASYRTVGRGLIEDYEATADEIVVYGHDYMGLLETTISSSNTSYTDTALGTIVSAQISAAIAESNSRLAFTSLGTIDATSVTATLLTSYQSRLDFIANVADVSMSDRSVRSILSIPRDSPYAWTFEENRGQSRPDMRLEYGGLVSDFFYAPGFSRFATRANGIGIKREGATILYSEQTYGSEATYGRIARPFVHSNVVNQVALDRMVKRDARRAGTPAKDVSLVLRAGRIAPWITYEIGDNLRVVIGRGPIISINALYTVWGMEWIVAPNGREELFLSLRTTEV